jgi:hypothetical protein
MQIIIVIVNGHWRPGIGDPTFIGWLITAAYLITFVLCGICAWRTKRINAVNRFRYHGLFWWGLAFIMFIMGMNKQLDLQCLFIAVVKKMALSQGWYSQRQILQIFFVVFVAIFGLILLIFLGWKLKRLWRQYGLALLGILLLVAFIAFRASPVNHVAKNSCWRLVLGLINSVLELTGIGLIGISALMCMIRDAKQAAKIKNS